MLDLAILAQQDTHVYGFEGTSAEKLFIYGFAGMLAASTLFLRVNLRLILFGIMLFATALTAPVDFQKLEYIQTWMLPAQRKRAEIHLGAAVVLSLLLIMRGKVSLHGVSAPGIILFLMAMYGGLLQFIHEDASTATQTIVFALVTIPCMLIAAPDETRDFDSSVRMMRMLMYVSAVWAFCCSVQYVIQPKYLVNNNGRFWGMLGNAQQAAILTAPWCVIAMWLILNDPQRRQRVVWVGLLIVNLLFLIWSGSRTGVLMLVLGSMFVVYARIGKAVLFMPVAAVVFFALFALADALKIGANLERLTSTEDTRGWVWAAMLQSGLESPLIGVGFTEAGGSENSYLLSFACYGIGYLLLVLALVAAAAWQCLYVFVNRRKLPSEYRALSDMFLAFNAMYFGGAMFEGYLLARSSTTLTMMLMFLGIWTCLKRQIADSSAEDWDPEGDPSFDPAPEYSEEYAEVPAGPVPAAGFRSS